MSDAERLNWIVELNERTLNDLYRDLEDHVIDPQKLAIILHHHLAHIPSTSDDDFILMSRDEWKYWFRVAQHMERSDRLNFASTANLVGKLMRDDEFPHAPRR
ncbi:hypothetical protein [Roseibium sp.]|uniref:hypothetical protein n=1 Tax=Roseibium sp. TaxID=1936156 RepID=UPI003BA94FF3